MRGLGGRKRESPNFMATGIWAEHLCCVGWCYVCTVVLSLVSTCLTPSPHHSETKNVPIKMMV